MALLPIFSHMRTHSPQRIQVSSSVSKRGFSMPYLAASFCKQRHLRAARQQQFDDQLAALMHRLGVGVDFHAFPDGIVAGRHKAGAAAVKQLHGAHAAHAGRLQRLMVAEGRDVDAVFFGHLKDVLAFFTLNCLPVEFKCNHEFYPFFSEWR